MLYCVYIKQGSAYNKPVLGIIFFAVVVGIVLVLQGKGITPDVHMLTAYREGLEAFLMDNVLLGALLYAAVYVLVVALSLPFATPLTLLAGFLFGNMLGTGLVVVAASIGATAALVLVRFFFFDYVKASFGYRLRRVHEELRGNGFRDILILRLTPIVPFALINLGAALTPVRVSHFCFATVLGTIPFTFIYVNAGTQLATLSSPGDVLSLPFVVGVSLVVFAATLPLLMRRSRH